MVSRGVTHAPFWTFCFVTQAFSWQGNTPSVLLGEYPVAQPKKSYVVDGVRISDFFVPFKGDFQEKTAILQFLRRLFSEQQGLLSNYKMLQEILKNLQAADSLLPPPNSPLPKGKRFL